MILMTEKILNAQQEEQCSTSRWDFSDLKAVFINCTLKKSPEMSHTEGLIKISQAIMEKNKVAVELIRAVDYEIACGVYADMTEHGWEKDDWPQIFKKIMAADILVLGSAIWLGEKTSICQKVIERLYGQSGELNQDGQYAYYGRVGGCLITGNEDGVKHCGMGILIFTAAPWVLSYHRKLMQAGLAQLARVHHILILIQGAGKRFYQPQYHIYDLESFTSGQNIKDKGGIPAHGNQRSKWAAGCRFDHPNPEYR
jgi:multimeric flavodoxin WrbA